MEFHRFASARSLIVCFLDFEPLELVWFWIRSPRGPSIWKTQGRLIESNAIRLSYTKAHWTFSLSWGGSLARRVARIKNLVQRHPGKCDEMRSAVLRRSSTRAWITSVPCSEGILLAETCVISRTNNYIARYASLKLPESFLARERGRSASLSLKILFNSP